MDVSVSADASAISQCFAMVSGSRAVGPSAGAGSSSPPVIVMNAR
jgi:hypothetical protein